MVALPPHFFFGDCDPMRKLKLKFQTEEIDCFFIDDHEEAFLQMRRLINSDTKFWGIDLETAKAAKYPKHPQAGLDPRMSEIRLLQLYDGEKIYIFDCFKCENEKKSFNSLVCDFLGQKKLIAHYAIFELKMLMHHFCEPTDMHCSMLLGNFVYHAEHSPFEPAPDDDEDAPKNVRSMSLAAQTEKYFGIRIPKTYQMSNWNAEELETEQLIYAGLDAVLTYKLGKLLVKKVNHYKIDKAYTLYKEIMPVLAEMELAGMKIDKREHGKLIKSWETKKEKYEKQARVHFGSVNLRSGPQLHKWVQRTYADKPNILRRWPKTDKGNYSFNKSKLVEFEHLDAVKALLAYKKYATLLSTFGESLLEKVSPASGRIHCSFTLGETRTGRLSSRAPNLQNMPARDESFRHIFVASSGCKLVVADFSQIEVRVAGELSRDPVIRRAFEEEVDLHKAIVAAVSGKPISEITKEERQLGKALNFGLQFGMGAQKLAVYAKASYGVPMTVEQAQHAWKTYHKTYKKYSSWCDTQRRIAERKGCVRTPMGRLRKLCETEVYTKAVNTPVQGGAAEVSFYALILLRKAFKHGTVKARILNTVHDEIIVECKEKDAPQVMAMMEEAMERGLKKMFPDACTKGLVEAHSAKSWSEAK